MTIRVEPETQVLRLYRIESRSGLAAPSGRAPSAMRLMKLQFPGKATHGASRTSEDCSTRQFIDSTKACSKKLAAAGHGASTLSHINVTCNLAIEVIRAVELTSRASMMKQSLGELVAQLETLRS